MAYAALFASSASSVEHDLIDFWKSHITHRVANSGKVSPGMSMPVPGYFSRTGTRVQSGRNRYCRSKVSDRPKTLGMCLSSELQQTVQVYGFFLYSRTRILG